MADALARMWTRFLPEIQSRAALVESAVRANLSDPLLEETEVLRLAGHQAAHKLAGSLGTFGLHRGTELARRLELWLDGTRNCQESSEPIAWVTELREMLAEQK